ncbi:hypothetical protein H7J06_26845 [Mycobacterium hodleri]|uniref:hypothetical protein n=1 Tax=Mycolicibacterium hodleri TaxID=49897 RepID=UPI0021F3944F|nr:hypothetical protein [Mycolicibacterium hodleri]MCV7136590.1 hypothetical protein [Mycolicibacterium hodleri]
MVGEVGIIVAGFVAALDAALNSRSLWDHRAMIRALRHDGAPAREERLLYAVAAVILVAGLIIAGVIYFSGRPEAEMSSAPAPGPTQPIAAQSGTGTTCDGWGDMKRDFQGMTQMPDGWTYDTPQIDIVIASRAAQLAKLLDIFTPQITPEPADVAAAAHAFVAAQSTEGPKLIAHTFGPADRANIESPPLLCRFLLS